MTRDLGSHRGDTTTFVHWVRWFRPGTRRRDPAATVATVEQATVDGTPREWELARQVYATEMLLHRTLIAVDEMLPNAATRAHQNDLLDLQNLLTGKAKP